MTIVDSLYFAITIFTTIGFGDFSFGQAPLGIKIYGIYLMLSGAGGYALLFALLADKFVNQRFIEFTGRKAHKMKNHVIVCGLGKVGIKILENLLQLEDKVVVIERDETANIQNIRNKKIPFIIGDVREESNLIKASIENCKAIIFCTDEDLTNLEGALTARELNKSVRIILRAYDQEFAAKIEKGFDIQVVFSTSTLAAPTFALAAHDENIISSSVIDGNVYLTTRLTFERQSNLIGKTLKDLRNEYRISILKLIRDGHHAEFPDLNQNLLLNDQLIITVNNHSYKSLIAALT